MIENCYKETISNTIYFIYMYKLKDLTTHQHL